MDFNRPCIAHFCPGYTASAATNAGHWAALITMRPLFQALQYVPIYIHTQIDSSIEYPFLYVCRMQTALLLGIDQLGPPPQHFLFSIVVVQHAYNEIFFGVISSIEVELAYQERDILLSDSFSYYSAPKGRIKYCNILWPKIDQI